MRRGPACTVIKLLFGRCFRCRRMVDGHVHLMDDPLRLFCSCCCPEASRHVGTGAHAEVEARVTHQKATAMQPEPTMTPGAGGESKVWSAQTGDHFGHRYE